MMMKQTFSGEIESPWWEVDEDEHEYRYDGDGPGRMRLHSFSGDIVVKQRSVDRTETRKKDVKVKR